MIMRKQHTLSQTGDTIVEVLFAVLVVGLAVGLAYGIANRSLRASRQAQERGEAIKLVEGQTESVKALASSNNLIFDKSVYCINDGQIVDISNFKTNIDEDTLSGYPEQCVKNSLYNLSIQRTGNDFTISARWFSLGSESKEQVVVKYRIYED